MKKAEHCCIHLSSIGKDAECSDSVDNIRMVTTIF